MAKQRRPTADRERKQALRRFFVLSEADQLRAHQEIKEHLGAELDEEGAADRLVAARASALRCRIRSSMAQGWPNS